MNVLLTGVKIMSLSDCPKCWDTPCTCGYEYRNDSKSKRIELASAILGVPINSLEFSLVIPDIHPSNEEYSIRRNKNELT